MRRYIFLITALLLAGCGGPSKEGAESPWGTGAGREIPASEVYADFKPTPEQYPIPEPVLKVKRTDIKQPRYPAVDIHFHGRIGRMPGSSWRSWMSWASP